MMRALKLLFAAALFSLASPALAQWQVPDRAVPIGNGAGVVGFSSATIGTAGRVLVDKGAAADPAFTVIGGDATLSGAGSLTIGNNAVTNAKAAQMAARTIKGNNTGSTANAADLTVSQAAALLGIVPDPGGRLTLTTGVPVLTSSVLTAATLYYTPFVSALVPLYDGTALVPTAFTELSLAFSSNSGHTGYHQSGKNFDAFVGLDGTTVRLCTGPAWSTDTSRGTGAGTTELVRLTGVLTNAVSMTCRFGSASGNTFTCSISRCTYVGTMRASANGQTEMAFGGSNSAMRFLVWNHYNRRPSTGFAYEPTDSWSHTNSNGILAYNSNNNIRASFVQGADDTLVRVNAMGFASQSSTQYAMIGICFDTTTAFWTAIPKQPSNTAITVNNGLFAYGEASAGIGFHFTQLCQYGAGAGSVSFFGDNGDPDHQQSGINVTVWN